MKSVMISIKPKYCELIASGKKTVEVRKTRPKIETPFKCYIYCTKPSKKYQTVARPMVLNDDELFRLPNGEIKYGNSIELIAYDDHSKDNFLNGKVIGEFICDYIYGNMSYDCEDSCVSVSELQKYANGKPLYGWHISDLVIYDEPKELSEFKKINRECWYADLGLAKRDCSKCKDENCLISRPPQSWCYVESIVYCKNCKYLMFSDFYAECGKGYRGILNFDDFCDKGELR